MQYFQTQGLYLYIYLSSVVSIAYAGIAHKEGTSHQARSCQSHSIILKAFGTMWQHEQTRQHCCTSQLLAATQLHSLPTSMTVTCVSIDWSSYALMCSPLRLVKMRDQQLS